MVRRNATCLPRLYLQRTYFHYYLHAICAATPRGSAFFDLTSYRERRAVRAECFYMPPSRRYAIDARVAREAKNRAIHYAAFLIIYIHRHRRRPYRAPLSCYEER